MINNLLLEPVKKIIKSFNIIPKRLAIGLSGGADSTMLAFTMASIANVYGFELYLFHINHGLQKESVEWSKNSYRLAALLKAKFFEQKVDIILKKGSCLEEAAREARYLAFNKLSLQNNIDNIFLAHHKRDQAETILLRLFRGTGIKGASAMKTYSNRDNITYIRPWLNIDHVHILSNMNLLAKNNEINIAVDPMNNNINYARSAIRILIEPLLNNHWPGWQTNINRFAKHMLEASEILDDIASRDLEKLDIDYENHSISLEKWRILSQSRRKMVIRYWLNSQKLMMPSEKRLNNLDKQLMHIHNLGYDRYMIVKHGNYEICCNRNRIFTRKAFL